MLLKDILSDGRGPSRGNLHNFVLNHVFWITSPCPFSIKRVQDVIAAAVKCHLRSDDNVIRRGSSTVKVGIPVPAQGSENKLILTSRSTLVSQMLGCSGIVNLDRLTDEEACQLFMNEARISKESARILKNIPCSLAKICDGVPHKIIDIATRMRGIDDPQCVV